MSHDVYRTLAFAVLMMGLVLRNDTAGALNIAGATAFVCEADGNCGAIDGSVPIDAVQSVTDVNPLVVGGGGTLAGILGARPAAGEVTPISSVLPAPPPSLRVTAEFVSLGTGVATAVAYWEDVLTLTAFDTTTGQPIIGALIEFVPSVRILGSLTAEGNDDFNLSGVSAWGFDYTINEFTTAITASGACNVPQADIVAECPGADSTGDAFGTYGPWQTVQVASGVPFSARALAWASVTSEGFDPMKGAANLGATADWLGFEVFDAEGAPITNLTVSSASGIDWTLTSVPEPSATLLQGTALIVLLGLAGRRHRN